MGRKPKIGDLLLSGDPDKKYHETFGMIVDIQNHVFVVEWYLVDDDKQTIVQHYYTIRAIKEFKLNYEKLKKKLLGCKNRTTSDIR